MFAALFNLEGMANQIIADTESRYECSATNAAALTADIKQEDKPKILWAQYFTGIGWSMASCPTWDATYYCEYAHHCGASIISRPEGVGFNQTYGSPTVYWYVTDEEFLELGKDAETWIYPSKTFDSVYEQKKEILDQFKSVQGKKVYDTQGQGPHGWHEQRLAEYDIVALDMCTLVGTNNPDSIHRNRWFRNYFDDAIGSPGSCDVPNELYSAYVPAQALCTPVKVADDSNAVVDSDAADDLDATDGTRADAADGTDVDAMDDRNASDGLANLSVGFGISIVAGVMVAVMA